MGDDEDEDEEQAVRVLDAGRRNAVETDPEFERELAELLRETQGPSGAMSTAFAGGGAPPGPVRPFSDDRHASACCQASCAASNVQCPLPCMSHRRACNKVPLL